VLTYVAERKRFHACRDQLVGSGQPLVFVDIRILIFFFFFPLESLSTAQCMYAKEYMLLYRFTRGLSVGNMNMTITVDIRQVIQTDREYANSI
jgi:hypothetical protein